mmetsp:Transcript_12357/g.13754  ORF Transcript_12357/g.13754 Transcript_12357/m.13754 type:complete len:131 (+) Transcript_12357:251-643(+)
MVIRLIIRRTIIRIKRRHLHLLAKSTLNAINRAGNSSKTQKRSRAQQQSPHISDDVDNDNVDGIPSLIDCWVSMVLLIVSTNDCVTFCHTEAFLLNFIAVTAVDVILFYYFILCFLLFDHGYSQYDAILY